ncbi:MAG: efflux RND transporter permease subunit [Bdellovibrionota bacterium]
MTNLVRYFADRPLLCNIIMFGAVIISIFAWQRIGKEEMPEFAREALRVSLRYPGASAADVELLVTKPIEEQLRSVSSIKDISSTASSGNTSIRVEFESGIKDLAKKFQDVKDAVSRAELPDEVDTPDFQQFNTAEKAIIDIALYRKGSRILDVKEREELQKYALAFKSKILNLRKVSGVDTTGYLKPEIQIDVDPKKLAMFELTMAEVRQKIREQHVRIPVGSMSDKEESSVTILSERETVESLESLIVRSGYGGQTVRLGQIARVSRAFEKNPSVRKVQGHEAVIFNIKKSISADILSAQKAIIDFIEKFQMTHRDSPIGIQIMDDESYDVRNRINLISSNGIIGFVLIVLVLFVFLDFKSGIWVGMGIPFALAFTLISAYLIGYTVNNMTLCAIIIVIGIVVDDAIIIAENIDRKMRLGETPLQASVTGTVQVINPIIAAILTTCVAFIPLYFFEARFGALLKYIPPIIFLMLGASLIESTLVLPSHIRTRSKLNNDGLRNRLLHKVELYYEKLTFHVLRFRIVVILCFVALLFLSALLFKKEMRFVMFPREESTSIAVRVNAPESTNKSEMAKLIEPLEDMFIADKIVVSVESRIGVSRRGGAVKENEASLTVELLPPDERIISLRKAMAVWENKAKGFKQFEEVRFMKSRWGRESGSPIEIQVQENDDINREEAVNSLVSSMKSLDFLSNVEVERPIKKPEYKLTILDDITNRLGVSATELSSSLRTYLEGSIIYSITSGDEEIDVRLSSSESNKSDIKKLLSLRASNKESYLVPIEKLVKVEQGVKPTNIQRSNFKRTTNIYADIKDGFDITPLEIAEKLEKGIFPQLMAQAPTTDFIFRGEIEDSRESQSDFGASILLIIVLIYVILVFLYNSLTIPLVIASIIPFGVIGVVLAFYFHGMNNYGFFAVVGTLGMIGVVINDAIVMVAKLEEDLGPPESNSDWRSEISKISATRLRPVVLTSITTVAGLFPTAYGIAGYDSMLAEMMLAMGWGLIFSTLITLLFLPCVYSYFAQIRLAWRNFRAIS